MCYKSVGDVIRKSRGHKSLKVCIQNLKQPIILWQVIILIFIFKNVNISKNKSFKNKIETTIKQSKLIKLKHYK